MRVKFSAASPFSKTFTEHTGGRAWHLVDGDIVKVSPALAERWMRDWPQCFSTAGPPGPLATAMPADVSRLRDPKAEIRIGIILTTFNGLDLTARCVQSLAPVEGVDLELYVVDNCSTDGTPGWLERNGIACEQPIGRCGVAEALNRGRRHFLEADKPPGFLLVLNNDVSIPAGYIEALLAAHRVTGAAWLVGRPRAIYRPDEHTEPEPMTAMDSGDASATLYTADALQRVGPWDERFRPRYGEDEDLLTRFELAGLKCLRLPVAYDGDMGGYLASNPGCERQEESHRRALGLYFQKWGAFPRSAENYRAVYPDLIGSESCSGYGKTADETRALIESQHIGVQFQEIRADGKQAAIIQNGHMGDCLLSFPMAAELKRLGYAVTWYAVPPYTEIAALCPDVDEVVDAEHLTPQGGGLLHERASMPAREHAEAAGFDRVLLAQIAPENQREYLGGGVPYIPFMYAMNGLHPASMRPVLKPRRKPRRFADVLINFSTHSAPIRIDWAYWSRFVAIMQDAGATVAYSQQPNHEWRGDVTPKMLKPLEDIAEVPYMARRFRLVITTSSVPLWSAYAHDVPAIAILPHHEVGRYGEGELLKQNAMTCQGILHEWQAMDAPINRYGRPESFDVERLADIVSGHLVHGHDLRGYALGGG